MILMEFQSDPAERSQRQEGKSYEASFKVRYARIVWELSNVYIWMNFAHLCFQRSRDSSDNCWVCLYITDWGVCVPKL